MKRAQADAYAAEVRRVLAVAGVPLLPSEQVEIADFGLGQFETTGLGLVVRVNEPEYCSKWLVLLAGQTCPLHYHKLKKETFFVHLGTVHLRVDGKEILLRPGERYTLPPGSRHEFWSHTEAVIEEVSTHDENADSYFEDERIVRDPVIED